MPSLNHSLRLLLTVVGACLVAPLAHAQSNETYDGGTNTWDAGITQDWNGSAVWTNGNNAFFTAGTNAVTVSGTVESNYMEFDGGATSSTISGGTIDQLPVTAYDPTMVNDYAGGPVTISSQIELSDMGGDQQGWINNQSSYTETIGNVDFGAYTINPSSTSDRRLNFDSYGSGLLTLNGAYTASPSYGYGQINFGDNETGAGNYSIASTATFSDVSLSLYSGNLYLNNSMDGVGFAMITDTGGNHTVYIQGAQSISSSIYDSMKYGNNPQSDGVETDGMGTIIQNSMNASTWSGNVNQDGTNLTLGAVAGGRLNWTGQLQGDTPEGLTISGDGVVVLAYAGGNNFDERDGAGHLQPTSTVAATLETGSTTLINNASGSAFGITSYGDSFYNNSGPHYGTVQLQAGATLGGTGNSQQEIVAEAATSVLTAGDPGQANLGINPSIGSLTLSGGVSAANGLTMDFKLSGDHLNQSQNQFGAPVAGASNDYIDMSSFTVGGTVTINLTALDPLVTYANRNDFYTLFAASSNYTSGVTFDIIAPTGYELDPDYYGTGYHYAQGQLGVALELVPEPSTYVMMLGGLVLLGFCVRRKLA